MDFLKRIWKLKQTKIALTILVIAGILAAAFFLTPKGGKNPTGEPQLSSSDVSQSSTAESENSQTPFEIENASGGSESTSLTEKPSSTTGSPEGTSSSENSSTTTNTPIETQKPDHSAASTPPKDNSTSSKDQYQTDPVPEDKPQPQEPQDTVIDEGQKLTCTLSIRCDTILDNMDQLKEGKKTVVPTDGVILAATTVTFSEGESVFDVLKRVTREKRIHMEFRDTPMYNSAYIEGIHNLYEFDCGPLSGWMYKVNDWFPNYGCSRYVVKDGDKIEWVYTCDLGRDVGGGSAMGQQ